MALAIGLAALGFVCAWNARDAERGKSKQEALRSLKRHISDAVWRQLQADLEPAETRPAREDNQGRLSTSSAGFAP